MHDDADIGIAIGIGVLLGILITLFGMGVISGTHYTPEEKEILVQGHFPDGEIYPIDRDTYLVYIPNENICYNVVAYGAFVKDVKSEAIECPGF